MVTFAIRTKRKENFFAFRASYESYHQPLFKCRADQNNIVDDYMIFQNRFSLARLRFWKIVYPDKQERAEKYFLPVLRIVEVKYSRYPYFWPVRSFLSL